MSRRRDYYHDPTAPTANSLIPGGSALVTPQERVYRPRDSALVARLRLTEPTAAGDA